MVLFKTYRFSNIAIHVNQAVELEYNCSPGAFLPSSILGGNLLPEQWRLAWTINCIRSEIIEEWKLARGMIFMFGHSM